MNLIFRLLGLLLPFRRRLQIGLLDTSELCLRVWPSDLDINRHLTNSRYLSMMDLGRVELILQTGLFKKLLKHHWLPVIANVSIQFKRQINPFQRFVLKTRVVGWDEKWLYIEQRFETEQGIAAVGIIKGLFRNRKHSIPTGELLALAGYDGPPPEITDEVRHIMTMTSTLHPTR